MSSTKIFYTCFKYNFQYNTKITCDSLLILNRVKLHKQNVKNVIKRATYLYLPLHCDTEQCYEIHDKYRPEHWYVEAIE